MLEPHVCFWTRKSSYAFYTILFKRPRLRSMTDKRKSGSRGLPALDRAGRAARKAQRTAELRRIVRRLKRILRQLGSSGQRLKKARQEARTIDFVDD